MEHVRMLPLPECNRDKMNGFLVEIPLPKKKRKQATNYHFVRHWEGQLPTQMICCVAERPLRDPPVLKKRSFSSSMANRAQVLGSCLSLWELRGKIFDVFFKIHSHSNLKWEFGMD